MDTTALHKLSIAFLLNWPEEGTDKYGHYHRHASGFHNYNLASMHDESRVEFVGKPKRKRKGAARFTACQDQERRSDSSRTFIKRRKITEVYQDDHLEEEEDDETRRKDVAGSSASSSSSSSSDEGSGQDQDGNEKGKKKRDGARRRYPQPVLQTLLEAFEKNPRPSHDAQIELAELSGLTQYQIKIWFQNRRTRLARLKKLASSAPLGMPKKKPTPSRGKKGRNSVIFHHIFPDGNSARETQDR